MTYKNYKSETRKRAIRILEQGRDLILTKGWATDSYQKVINGTTHYCAMGAVSEAFNKFKAQDRYTARDIAVTALHEVARSKGYQDIIHLNDETRDRRKVVRAFNRAIKQLQEV